jgi:hypothetical protein
MNKLFFCSLVLFFAVGCYDETVEVKRNITQMKTLDINKSKIGIMIPEDGVHKSFSRQTNIYGNSVSVPADKRIYGSGMTVCRKVREVLITKAEEKIILLIDGTTEKDVAIKKADERGLSFVILIEIYKWQEEMTNWTGVADKVGLTLQLYDVTNRRVANEINYYAESKFWDLEDRKAEELLDREAFYQVVYNLVGLH